MKIKNIDGLSPQDLQEEEAKGGRFVYFPYTISLLFITLKRTSDVYMVRHGESAVKRGMPFTILTALFGWWGIPFGPKCSLEALRANLKGGKDVTDEVMQTVAGHLIFQETQQHKAQETNFKF